MALDSTGSHFDKKVACFVCDKTELQYESYTPQYGHDGHAVDIGSCMGPHGQPIVNFEGAKFFRLQKNDAESSDSIWIYPVEIQVGRSGDPYHYGGKHEPDFGEHLGEVVFVCSHCVTYYETETGLKKRVAHLADWALDRRYGMVLDRLLNLFGRSKEQIRRRWRQIPERGRWSRERMLAELIGDLKQLRPHKEIQKILARCYRIQKAISPKRKQTTKAA